MYRDENIVRDLLSTRFHHECRSSPTKKKRTLAID
jgi:hypothetical protein